MWTCDKCGETHDDQFDSCWNCAGVDSEVPVPIFPRRRLRLFRVLMAGVVAAVTLGVCCGARTHLEQSPLLLAIVVVMVLSSAYVLISECWRAWFAR
jgi:hypothetical protein